MKKMKYIDTIYEAERIVKTDDSIFCYIDGVEVVSFKGISDFSGFELLDGAEWDTPTLNQNEQIIKDLSVILAETIKRELEGLDQEQQVNILAAELIKRELQSVDQNVQIKALGNMVSALELNVLAIKSGKVVADGV